MLVRQGFDSRFVEKIKDIENKYGIEMINLDGIGQDKLDINSYARAFFREKELTVADISIDANANVDDKSVLAFEHEFGKALQKLNAYYILWKKMVENPKYGIKRANKALELVINGALKIHDQHHIFRPYCYAFSLSELVMTGLPFIKKVKIGPPKHFKSFINLVIQFTAYASNQLAGAAAFPDLFVYMDWYARKDFGEDYHNNPKFLDSVKQELQSLVYSWNFPFRAGSQSSFTNVNLYDEFFLRDLFSGTIYPDTSKPNFESIKKLQKYYMEWFVEESKTQTFTFPVNTVTFYKDDNNVIQDKEFLDMVAELNCYNGSFNIYTGPLGSLSSCCRLRSDTTKTKEYVNSGFGVGGTSIGSHRVVTLNLPRIGFESEDDTEFFKKLDYNTKVAQDLLDVHRDIIVENINRDKLPLYTHKFMDLSRQFSTIGFIGINEACEIQGYDILDDQGSVFAKSIINEINALNDNRTKEDGHIRNVEQIPGESAAIMFAKKDKLMFTDHEYKMYGNQYIPLWKNVDLNDRIKAQGMFDSMVSGGAICHINVTDSLTKEQMKKIILAAAHEGCIYFAINMNNARCKSCGKLFIGKFDKSPCHNAEVTNYIRVVGFLVPVDSWIPQRREEYKVRQFYSKKDF